MFCSIKNTIKKALSNILHVNAPKVLSSSGSDPVLSVRTAFAPRTALSLSCFVICLVIALIPLFSHLEAINGNEKFRSAFLQEENNEKLVTFLCFLSSPDVP